MRRVIAHKKESARLLFGADSSLTENRQVFFGGRNLFGFASSDSADFISIEGDDNVIGDAQ
jgi:hypothetical protein